MPRITVLVPAYNEIDNLPELHRRLRALTLPADIDLGVLVVDDGSTDGTAAWLRNLNREDPRVTTLRLTTNRGHQAAIAAGLAQAPGDAVIVMDADLQNPPEYIPIMLRLWQGGAGVVAMRRASYAVYPWVKRIAAWTFYRLARLMRRPVLLDTPDFYLLDRTAVERLRSVAGRRPFYRAWLARLGLPVAVLHYRHEARHAGVSKYTLSKSLRLAVHGLRAVTARA